MGRCDFSIFYQQSSCLLLELFTVNLKRKMLSRTIEYPRDEWGVGNFMACKDKPANLVRSSKGDQRRWKRFQPFVLYQWSHFPAAFDCQWPFHISARLRGHLNESPASVLLGPSVALGDTSKASNSMQKAFDTLALKQLNFRSLDHVSKRLNIAEFAKSLSIFTSELTLANLSWNPRAAKKRKKKNSQQSMNPWKSKKKCLGIFFSWFLSIILTEFTFQRFLLFFLLAIRRRRVPRGRTEA